MPTDPGAPDSLDRPAVAPGPPGGLYALVAAAIIITGLYFARDILVPFALAVLITFVLAPMVLRLRRGGVGRIPAVLAVVTVSFAVIAAATWLVSVQLFDLAKQLPRYEANIRGKLQDFQGPGSGLVTETTEMFRHLRDDLAGKESAATTSSLEPAPIPVEVRAAAPTSLDLLRNALGSVLGPLATAGVVVVLVVFMLIQREDLRDRFFGLVGAAHLYVTTDAIDDAAGRVSRYLSMQLLINSSTGVLVGVGLYFIGVPNPLLWGVLAAVLRFVPFIGPLLSMVLPLAIAFAVDPGWTTAALALALFLAIELFSNNVLEPWLYGASTGISPVAIMMAAVFWTSIWGPMGLLLSTPLTVCMVVMGRHFPQLQFLAIMLGTERALPVEARFYQRLLAADVEEAGELAEELRVERGLARTYDELLVPALILLEQDRHRGALDEGRKRDILAHVEALVDHLFERDEEGGDLVAARSPLKIALVPANDDADEMAARMLGHLLRRRGIGSAVMSSDMHLGDRLDAIHSAGAELACVCAVPPAALPHAVYTSRRLRRRFPDLRTIVGVYSDRADPEKLRAKLPQSVADEILTSLGMVVASLAGQVQEQPGEWMSAGIPENEQQRLAELVSFGLLETSPEEAFDRVTRELAHIFGAPISLMSLVDGESQHWKSQFGLPAALVTEGKSDRASSMCGHVVASGEVLVVDDTRVDPRFADNPFLQRCGIRFYAGAPLRTRSGNAIGTLCVIDTKPRKISDRERELLRMIADAVMTEVELRTASRGLSEETRKLAEENHALQAQQPLALPAETVAPAV